MNGRGAIAGLPPPGRPARWAGPRWRRPSRPPSRRRSPPPRPSGSWGLQGGDGCRYGHPLDPAPVLLNGCTATGARCASSPTAAGRGAARASGGRRLHRHLPAAGRRQAAAAGDHAALRPRSRRCAIGPTPRGGGFRSPTGQDGRTVLSRTGPAAAGGGADARIGGAGPYGDARHRLLAQVRQRRLVVLQYDKRGGGGLAETAHSEFATLAQDASRAATC